MSIEVHETSSALPRPLTTAALVCVAVIAGASAAAAPPSSLMQAGSASAAATASGTKAPAAPGATKAPATAPAPVSASFPDKAGAWANFPANPPDRSDPFFQALGSNARTCATCHDPKDAWTVTPGSLQKRFTATAGTDPVFLGLDGTNCPTLPTTTVAQRQAASSLLLSKGLIRIAMTVPSTADFAVATTGNPYGCTSTSTVSVYRRVLPTSNLVFLSAVMWDGREMSPGQAIYGDLVQQANDAITTHAAGTHAASAASVRAAVALELEQFTAQISDNNAGPLNAGGGGGGPAVLATQAYSPGENTGASPQPTFTLYAAWENLVPPANAAPALLAQASIGRGERIFNTRAINISGVAGLNDVAGPSAGARTVITGTCGTCHNAPNAGSSSTGLMVNEGQAHVNLRTPDLPLMTLVHKVDGKVWQVTDPGVALVTGKWADIGKFKVPTLRGLAARAPYFHNGSAASLDQVINFYNTRFTLNLSAKEHTDLANFLNAL